ncbi:KpsF/GutQ family sugar-phosphate isomerase [Sphingomonas bacterium]|uniref:KpsF/GutQ family sugar-phosphate isomerase n=1 Tax=Sphingomonas bacterium TaxID=1895847 RepID=UPI001575EEE8|nr:KpsF/GutQ family sugar-phosphate isomerase [Sphingomonas bacterium]
MIETPAVTRSPLASALRTIEIERRALDALAQQMDGTDLGAVFTHVVELIVSTPGRIILTGMGKSGLVARKIAATLASTGTPSMFLHPSEASHGDLGVITGGDIVLALSWSGETSELADILNHCARFGIKLIGVTAGRTSTLARCSDLAMVLPQVQEACPNDLAPTSSTTIQACLGDALAVAALERRRFSSDDFRVLHPRGQLGARLVRVADIMSTGHEIPEVALNASIAEATLEMTTKRFGITAVLDKDGGLAGAFSDGDLRRSLASASINNPVKHHMSLQPFVVSADALATEALAVMNMNKISQLFVCDNDQLIGIVHVHDVLRVGVA